MAGNDRREMPKWRAAPDELKRRFADAVTPLPGVEIRKMFGYPAAFYNEQMFAGVFQESMMVRLSSEDRAELLAQPGAAAFEPMPGRPMREYVVLPQPVVLDPAALGEWLHRGLTYAASLPPKPAKNTKRPRARKPPEAT